MLDVRIDQAARLAQEWASLGSVELVVDEDNSLPSFLPVDGNEYRWIETHYIETPARQRFLEMSMKNTAGKAIRHKASYTDGKRYSVFDYRRDELDVPEKISLGTSFDNEASYGGSARLEPFRYYFIDKTPLHEALPSSTYLGTAQSLGKPIHVFLFKDVLWSQIRQDLVLYLAEDGILPQKVIFYKNEAARLNDKSSWSWTATKVESIQGKNIPTASRLVRYDPDGSGNETSTGEIVIRKAKFGKSFPQSTFWREIDPRATVFDGVKGKIIQPSIRPTVAKTIVINPVRVDPVMDNSSYLMAGGLAIATTAFLAVLILWFRRSG